MPGLRQRRFPLLGKGPALANLPGIGRTFQCGFIKSRPFKEADLIRKFWKMNVDYAARAVVSVRRVIQAYAEVKDRTLRPVLVGRWIGGVSPLRIKDPGALLPLYAQWTRLYLLVSGY